MILLRPIYCILFVTLFLTSSTLNAQGYDIDGISGADEIVIQSYTINQEVERIQNEYLDDPDGQLVALEQYKSTIEDKLTMAQLRTFNSRIERLEAGVGPAYYVNKIIGATGVLGVRLISDVLNGTNNLAGLNATSLTEISNTWLSFLKSMQILAGIIFILVIAIGVFKLFLNPGKTVISQILLRPILILVCLVLYYDLVNLLVYDPIEVIVQSVYPEYDQMSSELVKGYSNMLMALNHAAEDTGRNTGFTSKMLGNLLIKALFNLILFVLKAVIAYVYFLGTCMASLYFAIGPLAIVLSLVPGNKIVLQKWFFGFYSYLLWQPVIVLIMMVSVASFSIIQENIVVSAPASGPSVGRIIFTVVSPLLSLLTWDWGGSIMTSLFSLTLSVGLIFFLLMTPKIANILVGQVSEAAQGMISNIGDKAGNDTLDYAKKGVFGSK